MPASPTSLPRLRTALLRWYRSAARPFPWRDTRDPYRILVSEVMLQQTQASRVVPFYRGFLRQFPTIRALAAASPGKVLRAWQGLGYNMRALRLHALAVFIQRERSGHFPSTVEALLQLPGIGPYSARAIAIFAFNRAEAVVDTNVRRILHRWYPRSTSRTDLQAIADGLLARRAAHDWNQAVMELGATICLPATPRCEACPVARYCPSAGKAPRLRSKATVRERSYRGHPRRIYRGRIVSMLHRAPQTDASIAQALFLTRRPRDLAFVRKTLVALEKDGLVSVRRRDDRWLVGAIS